MNVASSCALSPVQRLSRVKKHPANTDISSTDWRNITAATSLKAACFIKGLVQHTKERRGTSLHQRRVRGVDILQEESLYLWFEAQVGYEDET